MESSEIGRDILARGQGEAFPDGGVEDGGFLFRAAGRGQLALVFLLEAVCRPPDRARSRQLPRAVTTVRDAHEVLRAPEVMRTKGKVARQGEWFFVEPTANELETLETALRGFRTIVRNGVPLGRGGNQHVADELVVVPALISGTKPVAATVFARGRVRHVDHDRVYLPAWTKVVRNTEPVADDGVARMDGIRWID